MVRANDRVAKLLRDVVDNPENRDKILEIARSNPTHKISEWISKAIFHHKNFDTPEKCDIMREIIYDFISINLKEQKDTAAFYTAEVCTMPLKGKEKSRRRYAPLSEDRIRMHEERIRVISEVYDRLEENGVDVKGKRSREQTGKYSKTDELLFRVRKGIRNRYHALGLTDIPKRYKIDKRKWLGNQHKRVA